MLHTTSIIHNIAVDDVISLSGSFFMEENMLCVRLNNYIVEKRPLVFLCGPHFNEEDRKDRRNILRKFIGNISINLDDKKIQVVPFALVIDKLFDSNVLENNMNLTLLEEIIAACAYRNYVFVDSMSTVLELGLFSNGYSYNQTIALLPKDYQNHKPSMGYFVTETLKKSRNISVCEYNNVRYTIRNNAEQLIGFEKNIVPNEIKSEIDRNFSDKISSYLINMEFTTSSIETKKIYYQISNDSLLIVVPARNLLYLVNKFSDLDVIRKVILEYFKQNVCYENLELMKVYYMVRKGKFQMYLRSPFSYDIEEVIENLKYFIKAIKEKSQNNFFKQRYHKLEYCSIDYPFYSSGISFFELMGIDFYELKHLRNIYSIKQKTLMRKNLIINGKKRKITMYKGTKEGMELRKIHTNLYKLLTEFIKLSDYSFAYKKNTSIKECVNRHLKSQYFLKLDIKDFFNSISKQKMNRILKVKFSDNEDETYEASICNHKSIYKSEIISRWRGVEDILKCCFDGYKLPLGLVTSPILANIYMDNFDKRFAKAFPQLIYTRYSDDILISSNNTLDERAILSFVKTELKYLKLTINEKKTKNIKLKETGDHIKFLGINIVKGNEENYISVGKKKIKDLAKDISLFLINKGNDIEKSRLIGMIEYIKFINLKDYEYLLKFMKVKTGREFDYEQFKNNHSIEYI